MTGDPFTGQPDPFTTMPLLRQFFILDIERATVIRHEVRRDPATGMTLTRAVDHHPVNHHPVTHNGAPHHG